MGLFQPPLGSQVQHNLLWTLHTQAFQGFWGYGVAPNRGILHTKQGIQGTEAARQGTSEHQRRSKEEGMMEEESSKHKGQL